MFYFHVPIHAKHNTKKIKSQEELDQLKLFSNHSNFFKATM